MRMRLPLVASAALLSPASAIAAGYDTPILYSAQHMGMGGAAIGYVDDPSAMFHNPAGLARSMGLSLMVNATLITGSIQSRPDNTLDEQTSEPILAVAPLLGASWRLNERVAVGLAFYPVASAGADYTYEKPGPNGAPVEIFNSTTVRFLELSPNVAVNLPGHVTLGAGWRIISASLDRKLTNSLLNFDANLSGVNLGGFRVGAQWAPIPELSLGVVYRNRTVTTLEDDEALVLISPERHVETDFTLPSKLGFGARVDLDPVALALDIEYAFQNQNRSATFVTDPALTLAVNNVFDWQDGVTVRAGGEFDLDERFFFRAGYIWDGQVSQERYPSAFGTPPAPTSTFTAGFGMKGGDDWKFNVALARRMGATTVDETAPAGECVACSYPGDYKLAMTGVYADFMWSFDVGHKPGAVEFVETWEEDVRSNGDAEPADAVQREDESDAAASSEVLPGLGESPAEQAPTTP